MQAMSFMLSLVPQHQPTQLLFEAVVIRRTLVYLVSIEIKRTISNDINNLKKKSK